MRNRNVFADILVRRFVRANRIAVVRPPRAPRLSASKRWRSGSALKTFSHTAFAALLLVFALPVLAGVREVGIIGLTVDNLANELAFYTNTLPFQLVNVSEASGPEQERLLEKAGQRMPVEDSYIAATARRHGLTIATGNDRHFRRPGLRVFNPFRELS